MCQCFAPTTVKKKSNDSSTCASGQCRGILMDLHRLRASMLSVEGIYPVQGGPQNDCRTIEVENGKIFKVVLLQNGLINSE
ncbi:hypothetical protein J437_LFUL015705 [Ladona fulva]|uniref:Uncharacterized protein n=1 Tax=Ladona fulva TaxID=123851 RepID=A0A8K0KIU1_LADFU|nr:hypothetical protein J437_LFUL015705 [Ladona fulva]